MKVIFNFIWSQLRAHRRLLALAALGGLALALRLRALPSTLETTDDVNFALALDHYDLSHHQPHFPGYPLYVLLARGFHLFLPPALSLALPGVLGTLLLIWAVFRALPPLPSLAATALLACAPTLVLTSASPGSDGLALALAGAALAWPFGGGSWWMSGALLGLALGARASYAPLVPSLLLLPLFLHRKGALAALGGLAAACLLWAVPFLFVVGPATLFHEAVLQLGGHFRSWGGSIATSTAGPGERALTLAGQVAKGLIPALLLAALWRPRISWRVAALLALPYALWAWLGQNLDHARHAAPLTVLLCVAVALAVDSPRRLAALAAALCLTLWQPLARPWRHDAVEAVRARLGVERVIVAGTHLPRVARYYAPELRSAPALDGAELESLVRSAPPGVNVVVASEVPALQRPGLQLTLLFDLGAARLYLAAAQPALVQR